MAETRTCVLFMTHRMDASIAAGFQEIKACQKPGFDVKLFCDKKLQAPVSLSGRRFSLDLSDAVFFDIASVSGRFKFVKHWGRGLLYGNTVLPVLDFAVARDYDFIWKVEYDVKFTGEWKDFFAEFSSRPADLLGAALSDYFFNPEWEWWPTLKHQGAPVPEDQRLRGFFPVMRLSRKACGVLSKAYAEGWIGHYECLMPTVLRLNGCSVEEIGGDGRFVPEERKNRFYTNNPKDAYLWPGTFVWRVPRGCARNLTVIPEHLYHPVVHRGLMEKFCHWLVRRKGVFFDDAPFLKKK